MQGLYLPSGSSPEGILHNARRISSILPKSSCRVHYRIHDVVVVIHEACKALVILSQNCAEFQMEVYQLGGVTALVGALQKYGSTRKRKQQQQQQQQQRRNNNEDIDLSLMQGQDT